MKKCQKCGAPLEGFLYNTIGKLLGVKPSASNPEICNKCEAEKPAEPAKSEQPVVSPMSETSEPQAPAMPEVKVDSSAAVSTEDKEKDDLIS